jgi:phosphoglycolate phosphatase
MRCGVIFDLDGTLLNTLDDLHASVNYALRQYGFPIRTKEEVRNFVGNGIRRLMQKAVPEDVDPAVFVECFQTFQDHYAANLLTHTAPYPGIPELIRKLDALGAVLGVVSNKFQEGVASLVKAFFGEHIRVAVGNRPEMKSKPAPDSLFLAVKELGLDVNRDRIYYVGDSDVDIATARNASLPIISVTWGFRTKTELAALSPDYLVDSPEEIFGIVKCM